MNIIKAHILESDDTYIAHICNAVSTQSGGLTHDIFEHFPYADIYKERPSLAISLSSSPVFSKIPGYITNHGDGKTRRKVINMVAQYYPGSPLEEQKHHIKDGYYQRERYFYSCLKEIVKLPKFDSISFPYGIGAGNACGDWANYLMMLNEFENVVSKQGTTVNLYRQ